MNSSKNYNGHQIPWIPRKTTMVVKFHEFLEKLQRLSNSMNSLKNFWAWKNAHNFWVLGETRKSMHDTSKKKRLMVNSANNWLTSDDEIASANEYWWWWWAQVVRLGEPKKWPLLFSISDWSIIMNGLSGEIGRTQEMTAVVQYFWLVNHNEWSKWWDLNYLSLCTVSVWQRVSWGLSCLLLWLGRSPTFDLECEKINPQASWNLVYLIYTREKMSWTIKLLDFGGHDFIYLFIII
jgi:hypothetical protein